MTIKLAEEIKKELLSNRQTPRNFPKSLIFPFDKLYMEIATQIGTVEISSECTLFDSVEAVNETKSFSDTDYWAQIIQTKKFQNFEYLEKMAKATFGYLTAKTKFIFMTTITNKCVIKISSTLT